MCRECGKTDKNRALQLLRIMCQTEAKNSSAAQYIVYKKDCPIQDLFCVSEAELTDDLIIKEIYTNEYE